jgi:16S rRNA (cytosine1402-N4)-methyltransferase
MVEEKKQEEVVYHVPVMLNECVDALVQDTKGVYVDLTFGGGGHSREIVSRLTKDGHLYAFDQDADAENNTIESNRFTLIRSNFRFVKNFLKYHGITQVDGVLADLGVSSHHLDDPMRGFSFRFDAPLDMRMNYRKGITAADVLNTYDVDQLTAIFRLYGELKNAYKLANAIIKTREEKTFQTVNDLIEAISRFIPKAREKKEMAKVFQALRIEVNHEMEALKEMLKVMEEIIRPEGRLVVMTYHSLEDRLVKNVMRTGNIEGKAEQDFYGHIHTPYDLVNRKVITASLEEIERNPRARSAKLRIAQRKEGA